MAGCVPATDVLVFHGTILDVLFDGRPEKMIVDLDAVTDLHPGGVRALMSGYVTAVEYGTVYHVINAHGRVETLLADAGVAEVLADSEDIRALLIAVLSRPESGER